MAGLTGWGNCNNEDELAELLEKLCDMLEALINIDMDLDDLATLVECLAELKEAINGQSDQFEAICDKLESLTESITEQLTAICEKIEAQGEDQIEILTEIKDCVTALEESLTEIKTCITEGNEAICDKLEAQTETLCEKIEALCDKLEAQTEVLCEKLDTLNETVTAINEAIETISETLTNIENNTETTNELLESLCEKIEGSQESLTAICDKLDTTNETLAEVLACLETLKENLADVLVELGDINTELDAQTELLTDILECLENGLDIEREDWCDTYVDPDTDEEVCVTFSRVYAYNSKTGIRASANDYDVDGAAYTIVGEAAPCDKTSNPWRQCVKWSSVVVQWDNTGTYFGDTTEITFDNTDGSQCVITLTPQTGWSDQVSLGATESGIAYPDSFSDPRCTFLPNGCGGLLPPPSDAPAAPGIYARYINMVFCPTSLKIPVSATITDCSNPARIGRKIPLAVIPTPEKRGFKCGDSCKDPGVLYFEDGTEVPAADLPTCTFDCAESIPETPVSACSFEALDNVCDNVNSEDDEDWVPVVRIVSICEGIVKTDFYIDDGEGGLEDYVMVGEPVDCESGEEVPLPPVSCDEPTILSCENDDGSTDCALLTADKNQGVMKPTGHFQCSGLGDSAAECTEYQNADNSTDISASQNTTTIKWQIQLGQEADADATGPAIADCIAAGGEATIAWTDQNGTTTTFVADSVVADGSANGGWAFGGTSTGAWSGKVNRVKITCSTGEAAEAITAERFCNDLGEIEWRDEDGNVLTDEQVAALGPCENTTTIDGCVEICPDCPTETISTIACAEEASDGVEIDDQLLILGTRDCEGNFIGSTVYNQSNGNAEVTGATFGPCDPQPEVETIRECITDTAGNQWTQLIIVNPDGSQGDPIYFSADSSALGTPAGDPKEWTSCTVVSLTESCEKCYFDAAGNKFVGKVVYGLDESGNVISTSHIIGDDQVLDPADLGLNGPEACGNCISLGNMYQLDSASKTGDLLNREWDDTHTTTPVGDTTTALARLTRLAHDPDSPPTTTGAWTAGLGLNDANNTAGVGDIQIVDGYLCVDEQIDLRWTTASEGYIAVEVGLCCSPLALAMEYGKTTSSNPFSPTTTLPAGVHQIRMWNVDQGGTNSSWTCEYSLDNGLTWTSDNTPPGVQFSSIKPVENCIPIIKCLDTGVLTNALTDDVLDGTELTACSVLCEHDASIGLLEDLKACLCGPCDELFDTCVRGFDYEDIGNWSVGQNRTWTVRENGVVVGTAVDDFAAQDNGNKSSWYTNLMALVNSGGCTMAVAADVASNTSDKPTWTFSCPANTTLEIEEVGGQNDVLTLTTDASGTYTTLDFTNGVGGSSIASETFVDCP